MLIVVIVSYGLELFGDDLSRSELMNTKFWAESMGHRVRVVKETDSKSVGVSPRRFESCRCRFVAF